jgi:hypothetical protein
MVKRLVLGLFIGLVVGVLAALAVVKGLGMAVLTGTGGAVMAYVAAAVTGVLTGLVAGKPIWAAGGKIEAGLKAFFGALIAAGGMFALRQWVKVDLNLSGPGLGQGALGELPIATLPIIATVLATFFELDNTGTEKEEDTKKRVAAPPASKKLNGKQADLLEDEEEPVASKKAKR